MKKINIDFKAGEFRAEVPNVIFNKKNIITKILIISFIIINTITINSLAVVTPTSDFYVNDYAGVINGETKKYIIKTNKSLYSQTGAQIVVVTVKNLESSSIEEYATELFRNFGIGDKSKNNGILLLLALEERLFRVEVGYGLEWILPDAKTGRIQDKYIIPYLKQNNWNDGIRNGYNAFLEIISKEYNVKVGGENAIVGNTAGLSNKEIQTVWISFGIILFSLIIGMIVGFLKKNKVKINKKIWIVLSLYFCIVAMIIADMFMDITVTDSIYVKQVYLVNFSVSVIANVVFFASGMAIFYTGQKNYIGRNYYSEGFSGGSCGSSSSSGSSRSSGGGGSSGGAGSTRSF